ncbi:MAG: protein kinase domain-containing protein [Rhodoglobus sp.]
MLIEPGNWPSGLLRRYTPLVLIAHGGMASVYRARDNFLGRDVAIKIFRASATTEVEFRKQEVEVNLLARLNHPNLVTLLDAAVDRGNPEKTQIYYVMELVEGTDLKRRLDDGPLCGRQVAQIGYSIATALEHVHGLKIVHRDVKPANILITMSSDGVTLKATLGDFGIASLGNAKAITDDEVVSGTVAYFSPEQAMGDEVGAASDVYSLGLVLLQCLTAELAFPGPAEYSALARLFDDPVIPQSVPADWHQLLRAMTARRAVDRPDIHDVAVALDQLAFRESGRHRSTLKSNSSELTELVPDGAFDKITALASRVLAMPIALISVLGHDRIWFTARQDIDMNRIAIDAGRYAGALLQPWPWVIEDALLDSRAADNPLLPGDNIFRSYVGVPLVRGDGIVTGTLCLLSPEPRRITVDDLATLKDLAAMAMRELELRVDIPELTSGAFHSSLR